MGYILIKQNGYFSPLTITILIRKQVRARENSMAPIFIQPNLGCMETQIITGFHLDLMTAA